MAIDQPDDQTLVTRALTGDKEAVQALLARHADYIRGIAVHSVPDDLRNNIDVDDILQALFLTLLHALRSYDPSRGTPREWLGGVTRRSVQSTARIMHRDKNRRSGARSADGDEDADDWLAGVVVAPSGERPSQEGRRHELRSVVEGLLARLPQQDRDLLVRCEIDDAPLATVAVDLGITRAAVAMRLYRIRQRCRELLGTETGSDYL